MRLPFSPVTAGQALQLSATEHNAFIRTALAAGQGVGESAAGDEGDIRILNDDFGITFEPGDVVRVFGEVRDNTEQAPINSWKLLLPTTFKCLEPINNEPLNAVFAIAKDRLERNDVGPGVINMPTTATVVVSNTSHRYARPIGKTLHSTTDPLAPFVILGTPAIPDTLDVNVWQKGISTVIREGTVTEALGIEYPGSGTVKLHVGGAEEQWDGANHEVTAYLDWLGGTTTNDSVPLNRKVFVAYFPDDDKWRIIAADCDPPPATAPPGHGNDFTASTTQTQAGATSAFKTTRVTECANDYDSIKLIEAEIDESNYIHNDTDNILRIWPRTGNRFTHQGENTHTDIPARTSVNFPALENDVWDDPRGFDTAGRTFDGTDDYISLASGSIDTTWTSADFTIYMDVLTPCTTINQYILNHGGGVTRFNIYIDAAGKLHIGGQTQGVIPNNAAMAAGKYVIQHDTAQTGFAQWIIYKDGVLQTNTTVSTHQNIGASTNNFELGRKPGGTDYADMQLRDFRFIRALHSVTDIEQESSTDEYGLWWHMNDATGATTCRDYTSNLRNGTYNGSMVRYEP